jgi:hypothetical protein
MIHGGVRWKTSSRPTSGWICGMNCTAEAPVPITATRSPASEWSWSHRSEWKAVPSKRSRPGMSGKTGEPNGPVAETRTRVVSSPSLVSRIQRAPASSQRASRSSVSKRT